MRAVSLFSGVGGFEIGFERAGIETVLQAERDPWCLEVLARHWPQTERVTDVRDVGIRRAERLHVQKDHADVADSKWGEAAVDLVYGGFPCQPFSVAGRRASAGDERNGWPEFRRVVSELRPRWVVAENVPGLLSLPYFGTVLNDLDELGFEGVAWAVLDAQHFGVPQRRRRVFVVAGPSRRGVEQVLSLCESCGGHPETGRAAGERVAVASPLGAHESGGYRDDLDHSTYITAASITASAGHHGHSSPRGDGSDSLIIQEAQTGVRLYETAGSLRADAPGTQPTGSLVYSPELAYALAARDAKGTNTREGTNTLMSAPAGVRRLTPRECERLMGWPDEHTRWTADGKEISDSHRYRMCGNGVVAPVAEWIGRRLVAVDALLRTSLEDQEEAVRSDPPDGGAENQNPVLVQGEAQ